MISKQDITQMLRRVARSQRGLSDHQLIHPTREWATGLLLGVIALCSGGAWSYITFNSVKEREVESVTTEEINQDVYKADIVQAALEEFRDRKESYESHLQIAETLVPSIVEVVDSEPEPESVVVDETTVEVGTEEVLLTE